MSIGFISSLVFLLLIAFLINAIMYILLDIYEEYIIVGIWKSIIKAGRWFAGRWHELVKSYQEHRERERQKAKDKAVAAQQEDLLLKEPVIIPKDLQNFSLGELSSAKKSILSPSSRDFKNSFAK